MRVTLFEIGGFSVHSYGVVVALAVVIALGVGYYLTRNTQYQVHLFDSVLYVSVAALVGARIWHVFFFQWGYYSQNLSQIFAIWNGGISIMGALVGGFLGMAVYARKKKISFWGFMDHLAPAIILGQAVGRIACFLNGDAYGSPTGMGFGIVYPEGTMAFDRYGSQPLWPAEIWEGQWDLIVFGILMWLKNIKMPDGFMFLSYNILYSIGRFALEFLRGDSPRYALDWTAGQWTSFAVIVISIALMIYLFLQQRQREGILHEPH